MFFTGFSKIERIVDISFNFYRTFSQCQALENQYYETLQGVVVAVIEKVEKGQDVEDMPEDVKMVNSSLF